MIHKYTPEEGHFFEGYVPGHTYREVQEQFLKEFGWEISLKKIKAYMGNHKLNNGLTGKFKKGRIPHNKGIKGVAYPGSERGWFKSGNIPKNHKPVGSERFSKKGYYEIKTAEPNKWEVKQRVIWERNFGKKIPKGQVVIFLDGNINNFDPENLAIIPRRIHMMMNQHGLRYPEKEATMSGIALAELINEIGKKRKNR